MLTPYCRHGLRQPGSEDTTRHAQHGRTSEEISWCFSITRRGAGVTTSGISLDRGWGSLRVCTGSASGVGGATIGPRGGKRSRHWMRHGHADRQRRCSGGLASDCLRDGETSLRSTLLSSRAACARWWRHQSSYLTMHDPRRRSKEHSSSRWRSAGNSTSGNRPGSMEPARGESGGRGSGVLHAKAVRAPADGGRPSRGYARWEEAGASRDVGRCGPRRQPLALLSRELSDRKALPRAAGSCGAFEGKSAAHRRSSELSGTSCGSWPELKPPRASACDRNRASCAGHSRLRRHRAFGPSVIRLRRGSGAWKRLERAKSGREGGRSAESVRAERGRTGRAVRGKD